jgi:uncharacterized protein YlxW (UPF0749 family)
MPEPMSQPMSEQSSRHTGTTGRRRLLDALTHARRSQIVVAVLLATVGFGAVVQVRSNDNDASYAGYREQDLIQVLNGLAGTSQRAQSEIARLEQTRSRLESDTSKRQAALDQADNQDTTLRILAGLVPVTGPGIRITITEATGEVNVDSFIDLVEELRSAGAEAMQINGKARLVAQSSFGQGADGLYVDHQLLTPPYIIEVIGEPATLAGAVTFARGPQDEFADDGAQVKVTEVPSLDITSVRKDTGQ